MNAEMQVILDQLEEENLGIRKKAIEALKKWEYQLELEDACLLLEKAAEIKPLCEDEWDNPSYALVTAACIFIHEDMVPVIEKNILRYSLRAAIKVLSFLLVLNTESAISLYKKTFHQFYDHVSLVPEYEERNRILEEKEPTIILLDVLLEHQVYFHPWYEWCYHYFVAMGIEKQYFKAEHYPLNKEYIHNELEELFAIYLEKHEIYTQELAYEVWKDSYLKIRYNLRFLLTLYFSFCTDKEAYALQNILKWKDNQIRLIYIELMWKRGLEIGIKEIEEILKSTDGSQEAFIIINENKPELLPRDPVFQNYFVTEAARFIFYNHEDGIEKFPSEVEIMGSFEWKEYEFDENLMYYVVRFKSADPVFKSKGWMRMLIGAYHTGSIPTSYNLVGLDDHYTDFETWDNKTFNEHVTDFQNFLREKHQKNIDEIFYDYIPIFDKKNNTIALISFISSFF